MLRGVKILKKKTIDKRRQSLSGGSDFNKWRQLCLRKDTVPSVCGVLGLNDLAVLQSPKPQPPHSDLLRYPPHDKISLPAYYTSWSELNRKAT